MTDSTKNGVPIHIALQTIKPLLLIGHFFKVSNPHANLAKAVESLVEYYAKATVLDTINSMVPVGSHWLASMPWISLNNCTAMDATGRCVECQRGYGVENGVCEKCKRENYSTDGLQCIPVENCFEANHTHGGCINCLEGFKKDANRECQKIGEDLSKILKVICAILPVILLIGIVISQGWFLNVAIYLTKSDNPADYDRGMTMLEYLSNAPFFNQEAMLALGEARQTTKRRRQRVRMWTFLQVGVLFCIICRSRKLL